MRASAAPTEEPRVVLDKWVEDLAQWRAQGDRVVVDVSVDLHAGPVAYGDADAGDGAGYDIALGT